MKIQLWVITIIIVGLCIAITGFSVFGAAYTAIQNQRNVFYQNAGATVKSFMIANVQRLLDNLYEAAVAVQLSEPLLSSCSMPNSSYNPDRLIRLFNSLSADPSRELESMGFMMRDPTTVNGKISWEIAHGFGCPEYIYAFADSSIYPQFLGFCASANGTVNYAAAAYNGTDWGLKAPEYDLLVTNPQLDRTIHLPVFPLLGYLTITVEHTITCPSLKGAVYGAVYAEQSLSQLDQSLSSVTEQGIVAFIVENTPGGAGYLVASSIANQTEDSSGCATDPNLYSCVRRVMASSAPDSTIRNIYSASLSGAGGNDASKGDWWIESTPIVANHGKDVNWTLICGIPKKGLIDALTQIETVAISVCVAIIIAISAIAALLVYFFVSRPLRRITQRLKEPEHKLVLVESHIEEIAELEQSVQEY